MADGVTLGNPDATASGTGSSAASDGASARTSGDVAHSVQAGDGSGREAGPPRVVRHVRSRTFDLANCLPSQGQPPANRDRDNVSPRIEEENEFFDRVNMNPLERGIAFRRVNSDTRATGSTRCGLAQLESAAYNVVLTSEDEKSTASEDGTDKEDGLVDDASPNAIARWKKSRKTRKPFRRKLKSRKNKDSVEVALYKDNLGAIRDEYGFIVSEKESLCLFKPDGTSSHPATVPHQTKKIIMTREAIKQRQKRHWAEFFESAGDDLESYSPLMFERWRKYYLGAKPKQSAERYLSRISAPSTAIVDDLDLSGASVEGHRKIPSNGSNSSQRSGLESPRRAPRFLKFGSTVVRKLRGSSISTAWPKASKSGGEPSGHREDESFGGYGAETHASEYPHVSHIEAGPPTHYPSGLGKQLTQLIRHTGIPPQHRRQMWLLCSGALRKLRDAGPIEQYDHLVRRASRKEEPPVMADIIERDLHRTFPTNYHFKEEEGIAKMRRVLLAYSLRNTSIGYCQSMNFLVAVLLLHMEEHLAFWTLAAIVEDLVPGHYTQQLTGMHVDQKVFESLVKQRLPKVHAHLEALSFPLEFVTYQWFLCLFVNALPLETTLRIWDCFLHEGSKALFRAGLAILMILQRDILAAETFNDVHECLSLSENVERKALLTGEKVLKIAYDPILFMSFPSSKIAQLRAQHLPEVLKLLGKQGEWEEFRNGRMKPGTPKAAGALMMSKVLTQDRQRTDSEQTFVEVTEDSEAGVHENDGVYYGQDVEDDDCVLVRKPSEAEDNNTLPHLGLRVETPAIGKSISLKESQLAAHERAKSVDSPKSSSAIDREGAMSQIRTFASETFAPSSLELRRKSGSFQYQLNEKLSKDPEAVLSQLGIRPRRSKGLSSRSLHPQPVQASNAEESAERQNSPLTERDGADLQSQGSAAQETAARGPTAASPVHVDTGRSHLVEVPLDLSTTASHQGVGEQIASPLDSDSGDVEEEVPSEFSGLLPTLAFAISARQVRGIEESASMYDMPTIRWSMNSPYEHNSASSLPEVGGEGEGEREHGDGTEGHLSKGEQQLSMVPPPPPPLPPSSVALSTPSQSPTTDNLPSPPAIRVASPESVHNPNTPDMNSGHSAGNETTVAPLSPGRKVGKKRHFFTNLLGWHWKS